MVNACLVLEGRLKFRDKKKWKSRWGVLTRLSPVADSLTLQLYKDEKDRTKGGSTKSTLALEGFFGTETGQAFTASLLSVPPRSRLRTGLVRLHLRDWKFALTEAIPPRLIGIWNLPDLRRYGAIEGGRFCFEAGVRSLSGLQGLFVLSTPSCEELSACFNMAARGRLDGRRPSFNNQSHNFPECSSPRIMRSTSRVDSRMSQCSSRYNDWMPSRDSTLIGTPISRPPSAVPLDSTPRSNLSSPSHYTVTARNSATAEDITVYEQLIYEKNPVSQLYDTPRNIPLWAKSPFKVNLTPQPARRAQRDPMQYYDVPKKLQKPEFLNYDIPPSTPRTVSRPPRLDSSPEEVAGMSIVKVKLDGQGRMPVAQAPQPLYAIVDKTKKRNRSTTSPEKDSSETYLYMKPLEESGSQYLKMQLEKHKSLRFYSLNRARNEPAKISNSVPASPRATRVGFSEQADSSVTKAVPSVSIRRSASVPNKANRDSSSSDSGLSVGSGVEPPSCHHASLPRKFLPTLAAVSSENKESGCDDSRSSSGTSDLLDYMETISVSSEGSDDHLPGSVRSMACTLRPRSGPEYAPLKQAKT